MSIPADWIPATADSVPPAGWVLIRREGTSDDYWVDPKKIKSGGTVTTLTDEQEQRVREIATSLRDVCPDSEGKWLDNFSKDREPEREIRTWEAIALTYEAERPLRPIPDHMTAFGVIVNLSLLSMDMYDKGKLLSIFPKAKKLDNLKRLMDRYLLALKYVHDFHDGKIKPDAG